MSTLSHHLEGLLINDKTIQWLTALSDVDGGGISKYYGMIFDPRPPPLQNNYSRSAFL